jgi:hypothetical protein
MMLKQRTRYIAINVARARDQDEAVDGHSFVHKKSIDKKREYFIQRRSLVAYAAVKVTSLFAYSAC